MNAGLDREDMLNMDAAVGGVTGAFFSRVRLEFSPFSASTMTVTADDRSLEYVYAVA
jgi:hypothetical protein